MRRKERAALTQGALPHCELGEGVMVIREKIVQCVMELGFAHPLNLLSLELQSGQLEWGDLRRVT